MPSRRTGPCALIVAIASVIAGCGAASGLDPHAAAHVDAGASIDASAPPASTSCDTLTLALIGCDDAARAECNRERDAVSAAERALIDADAACFRSTYVTVGAASWPSGACDTTTTPPLLSLWSQWFHGACQGDNGQIASTIMADPGFPACGHGMPQRCFFGGYIAFAP